MPTKKQADEAAIEELRLKRSDYGEGLVTGLEFVEWLEHTGFLTGPEAQKYYDVANAWWTDTLAPLAKWLAQNYDLEEWSTKNDATGGLPKMGSVFAKKKNDLN